MSRWLCLLALPLWLVLSERDTRHLSRWSLEESDVAGVKDSSDIVSPGGVYLSKSGVDEKLRPVLRPTGHDMQDLSTTAEPDVGTNGDVVCSALDDCVPWRPEASTLANSRCNHFVKYTGPGGAVTVFYDSSLDTSGMKLAPSWMQIVRDFVNVNIPEARNPPFSRAFEWCAGQGFLSFAHLAAGLVRRVVVSDIDPRAVSCMRKTVEFNQLESLVEVYLGNGLRRLLEPSTQGDKFDLVLGSPPSYENLPPGSPSSVDLSFSDPGWVTHANFFSGIRHYSAEKALFFICEDSVDLVNVSFLEADGGRINYIRREKPRDVFDRMAKENGIQEVNISSVRLQTKHGSVKSPTKSILVYATMPHWKATTNPSRVSRMTSEERRLAEQAALSRQQREKWRRVSGMTPQEKMLAEQAALAKQRAREAQHKKARPWKKRLSRRRGSARRPGRQLNPSNGAAVTLPE